MLLATKLHVPGPMPGFVPRPRLVQTLAEGPAAGRVLVCAPAGSGKTALLAGWVRGAGQAVAWVSLDGGDSDPARFWRYVVTALDRARPGLAGRVGPLLGPPEPRSYEGLVTAVINELAADPGADGLLLVLDDYHLIDSGPVHESVAFLLDHVPPGLSVVVSSRSDPPFPLARLRARGQLVEIRAADLRFTSQEAAALLAGVVGSGLPASAAEALTARTEGWAAGLRLAALSMRGHADPAGFVAAFSGSHRFVLDYLGDEVLDRQSEQVRAFLLETSVLERLSPALCDAVTGRADSRAVLQEVEESGLFLVPLDDVRGWWRYHHMFAELLRARLQTEQPYRVRELHRAAAAWCEEHGLADDAIRHALAAEDVAWAARLVEGNIEAVLGRSEGATLRRWLSAVPAQALRDRPRLCLAQAYGAAMGFQLEKLDALIADAERAVVATSDELYEDPDGSAMSVLSNVPAAIAFLRGTLARLRGDAVGAADENRRALAELAEDEWLMRSLVRWNESVTDWLGGRLGSAERGLTAALAERPASEEFFVGFLTMRVRYDLGEVQRARGDLDAALATFTQALDAGVERGRLAQTGMAHVGLAQVLYERNELAAALDHATQGVALCRQLSVAAPLAVGLAVEARIRHACGEVTAALEAMGQAGQVELSPQVAALFNPVPSLRARLLLAEGDLRAAEAWTTAAGLDPAAVPDYPREAADLVLARVLLARNDLGPARTLLRRMLDTAVGQGRIGGVIEIQALLALVLAADGDQSAALDVLTESLVLAGPRGYVRVFADEGAPMRTLLVRLSAAQTDAREQTGRIDPGYLAAVLSACGPADLAPPRRSSATSSGLSEPLTGRELEVLRLLAAGASNQRIAHDLVVALDTVKKHVTHVLGKLGAANRTEAAARARQLGLIP